ncbi:MAG: TIGR02186 family protein [Phenylobacterium sp.]
MADQPYTQPAPAVSAALAETNIRVASGPGGARVVVYGAVFDPRARPSDVVVLVRGPGRSVRLARKSRILGLWLNGPPKVVEGAPGFYRIASTRPLAEIADGGSRRDLGLGVDAMRFGASPQTGPTQFGAPGAGVSGRAADDPRWREAVVRLYARRGLYGEDPAGVRFVDPGLFRAEIGLPAAAAGTYRAEVLLIQDGRPVARRARSLQLEPAGPALGLQVAAHRRPWLYGVAAAALALAAGWLASLAFRRT